MRDIEQKFHVDRWAERMRKDRARMRQRAGIVRQTRTQDTQAIMGGQA